ncbi:MAG: hypothetical protein JWP12_645 [Bacteroidetes bacterium]|nr:hypothetical protein [Bacteroidota bacterium]
MWLEKRGISRRISVCGFSQRLGESGGGRVPGGSPAEAGYIFSQRRKVRKGCMFLCVVSRKGAENVEAG